MVFGLYLSKERALVVGRAVATRNHEFWEMVGFLSNSLIFCLSGLIIHAKLQTIEWIHIANQCGTVVAMYFALHVVSLHCVSRVMCSGAWLVCILTNRLTPLP